MVKKPGLTETGRTNSLEGLGDLMRKKNKEPQPEQKLDPLTKDLVNAAEEVRWRDNDSPVRISQGEVMSFDRRDSRQNKKIKPSFEHSADQPMFHDSFGQTHAEASEASAANPNFPKAAEGSKVDRKLLKYMTPDGKEL